MSSFILNEYDISTIVSYFIAPSTGDNLWVKINGSHTYMEADKAATVARILAEANTRGVNARYGDDDVSSYVFERITNANRLDISEIVKTINSLEYNSCDADDYHDSEAYGIICSMRKHLLNMICETQNTEAFEF